jgi:glycosyltransferase 2 family protein
LPGNRRARRQQIKHHNAQRLFIEGQINTPSSNPRIIRQPWFWLGIGISLLCLWLAARSVSYTELKDALRSARYVWLIPAVALVLLSVVARAWRWVVLLDKREQLADSFWAQGLGYLFTNIFPLRLGEPARVLAMSRRCRLPVMQVAASAIVERLLDAATNVLVLSALLPWLEAPALVRQAGLSLAALTLAGFVVLLLLVRFDDYSEMLFRSVFRRLPSAAVEKLLARWKELVTGFIPLTHWRTALQVSLWSLITWGTIIVSYWCILRAFEPDARVVEGAFMMVTLSFAVAVPSSPGFVGIFQFAGQQALMLPFGAKYDATTAFAITLTAHIVYYVPTTGLGLIGLWRLGESFFNLGRGLKVAPQVTKIT